MLDWFNELTALEKAFAFCAAFGGMLFMVRVVLMLFGMGDHEADVHPDVDGDIADQVDAGVESAGQADASDFSFKLLTMQGVTAFFMMFGLVGLAMTRGSGLAAGWALAGGAAAGLLAVWLISWVFVFFKRMQHSGTMSLGNAVGQTGKVYLTIPQGGTGKVQVVVQGRLAVLDAVSEDGSDIPSDRAVAVTGVKAGTLVVRKAD
jgi:hypothetical protein